MLTKSFYCFILSQVEVLELNTEPFKKLGKYTDDSELPFGLGPYGVSSDFLKICDNV